MEGRLEAQQLRTFVAAGGAGGIGGIDGILGDLLDLVLANDHQKPVGSHRLQPDRAHQQATDHAALDVDAVLRQLVEIGRIDDVGVGDQAIAGGGE